ncbi:MAG: hypothetical protein ACFBZ8_12900 [Opitutales bacterium]
MRRTFASFLFTGVCLATAHLHGELSETFVPTNPLTFQTEVGTAGTKKDAIPVRLVGIVTPERTSMRVELNGREISLGAALSLADLLDTAIERAKQRQEFSAEIDGLDVKVKEDDERFEVRIKLPGDGLFKRGLRIDSEDAFLLARLLRRSSGMATWLQPRMEPLLNEEPATS